MPARTDSFDISLKAEMTVDRSAQDHAIAPERESRSNRRAFLASGLAGVIAMPAIGTGKASAAEFRYKVGNQTSPTHPCTIWLEKASADILAQSGGRVDIKVHSGGQLGGMPDMISQLRSGALEMLMVAGQLSTFVPEVSLFGIGYAFASYDQVGPLWTETSAPT